MTARLAQNKLFVVLALAALAILAFGAASAAMGSSWIGSTVTSSQLPRERAELVDGYVAWEVHDASGALVASGGSANEITQAGLDYLLGEIGAGGNYTHIGILQGGACALDAYGSCSIASDADFDGARVLAVTNLFDGDIVAGNAAGVPVGFTADHRVRGVESGAFLADGDNVAIDAIVLTSASADSLPDLATVFAFNDDPGWTVPNAGSTITFRWYIGVVAD